MNDRKVVGADRVLAVLVQLAGHPEGIRLEDLSRLVDSPPSTVHRALASLRRAGFAAQPTRGVYLLGDEFLRLAFSNHEARPEHTRVQPALEALSKHYGESTHFAVLDEGEVVYRAKVDPAVGAIRLTSTVGGRNPAHCTGVGKVLLAYQLRDDAAVEQWAAEHELCRRTEHTIVTTTALARELAMIRDRGFSVDREENEVGINCLALPVLLGGPSTPTGAISISALAYRTPVDQLIDDIETIRRIVHESIGGGVFDPQAAAAEPEHASPATARRRATSNQRTRQEGPS